MDRIKSSLTLAQHLVRQRGRTPEGNDELDALIADVALACQAIAFRLRRGVLDAGPTTMQRELIGDIYGPPVVCVSGSYLLRFQPLDRPADLDIDVTLGSIFSVMRLSEGRAASVVDELQPGSRQVCAGYAVYGPSSLLVLTQGNGAHAYTLEPVRGRWLLSHPFMRIPAHVREIAIDVSNSQHWEPAVKRYVDECLAGTTGPRQCRFTIRWTESIVAETHRSLVRGGTVLYPRDMRDQGPCARAHRPHLLHEVNPISFLVEQAGGRATTGRGPPSLIQPDTAHQRIGFIFGSHEEVARLERYAHEEPLDVFVSPLFGQRGLFAAHDS